MARSAAPSSASRFKEGQDKGYRGRSDEASTRGREVGGIVLLGVTLFFGLSLISFQFGRGPLMGPVGSSVALALYAIFGVGGYFVVAGMGTIAVRCLIGGEIRPRLATALAGFLGGVSAMMLLHLLLHTHRLHGHAPGGLLGEYGAELLSSLIGRIGTGLFAGVAVLCAGVLLTPLSLRGATEAVLKGARVAGRFLWESIRAIFPDGSEEDASDADEEEEQPTASERRSREEKVEKKKRRDDTEAEQLHDLEEEEEPEAPMLPIVAAPVIVGDKGKPKVPKKKRDDEA
jgi:hypothetical protein